MLYFYRSLLILYFICILLLLLPTWRIKPDNWSTPSSRQSSTVCCRCAGPYSWTTDAERTGSVFYVQSVAQLFCRHSISVSLMLSLWIINRPVLQTGSSQVICDLQRLLNHGTTVVTARRWSHVRHQDISLSSTRDQTTWRWWWCRFCGHGEESRRCCAGLPQLTERIASVSTCHPTSRLNILQSTSVVGRWRCYSLSYTGLALKPLALHSSTNLLIFLRTVWRMQHPWSLLVTLTFILMCPMTL